MDIQHRRLDRVAVHHRLPGQAAVTAFQQRDVGGGAAHVEGDQVVQPGQPPDGLGADHAGGGAGQHRPHRQPRRLIEADDPTVGLRQMRRRCYAQSFQPLRQPCDVASHDRPEVGVDHGGGQALEFPEFRRDLVGDAGEGLRKFLS